MRDTGHRMDKQEATVMDMTTSATIPVERRNTMSDNLGANDREVLERFLWALETLKDIRPGIQVHMVCALVRVALKEGKNVAELTRDAGVPQSVMSRSLLDLGPITRDREPGLQLVEHKLSATNMRQHEVYLTKKGASLMRKIAAMLTTKRGSV